MNKTKVRKLVLGCLIVCGCCIADPPTFYANWQEQDPNFNVSHAATNAAGNLYLLSILPDKYAICNTEGYATLVDANDMGLTGFISDDVVFGDYTFGQNRKPAYKNLTTSTVFTLDTPSGFPYSGEGLLNEQGIVAVSQSGRKLGVCRNNYSGAGVSRAVYWDEDDSPVDIGTLIEEEPNATMYAGSISDDGVIIVGTGSYSTSSSEWRGFKWTESGGFEQLTLPFWTYSGALDISNDGSVIVGYAQIVFPMNVRRAVYWDSDDLEAHELEPNEGGWSNSAFAVNKDGTSIVGLSFTGFPLTPKAFLWKPDTGKVLLQSIAESLGVLEPNSFEFEMADGISRNGLTITGWGRQPGSTGSSSGFVLRLPCPGDADHNNIVDQDDLDAVIFYMNQSVSPWSNGDLDGDGDVDQDDLDKILYYYNTDCLP